MGRAYRHAGGVAPLLIGRTEGGEGGRAVVHHRAGGRRGRVGFDIGCGVRLGLEAGQVCVMLHTGSRGIGHQTCTDHLKVIDRLAPALGIRVPDRQLSCLPVERPEAAAYLGAMHAAGNFALANRHVLADGCAGPSPRCWGGRSPAWAWTWSTTSAMARLEEHEVDGRRRTLCVHRKGATRARTRPPWSRRAPRSACPGWWPGCARPGS